MANQGFFDPEATPLGWLDPEAAPLGWFDVEALAPVSTGTPISGTDSGSGTQAQTLVAKIPSTQTGSGSETGVPRARVASTQTNGTVTETTRISIRATDSGSGSEVGTPRYRATSSDSGSGTQNQTLHAAYAQSQTNGTTTEASTLHAAISSTQTNGTTTEATRIAQRATDTGSGTQNQTLKTVISSTQSGSDSEASTLHAALASSQTGSGSDAGTLKAKISSTQTGSDSEAGSARARISTVDYGSDSPLRDNFNDNSLDAVKWFGINYGSGEPFPVEQNQRVEITLRANTGAPDAPITAIQSRRNTFDIVGLSAEFNLYHDQPALVNSEVYAGYFSVDSRGFYFGISNGLLEASIYDGVYQNIDSVAITISDLPALLRLRESGGTLYWEWFRAGAWQLITSFAVPWGTTNGFNFEFGADSWDTNPSYFGYIDEVHLYFKPEETLHAALTNSDSGPGTETQSRRALYAQADSGTDSEASTLQAAISTAEAGSSSESATTGTPIHGSDTGSGTERISDRKFGAADVGTSTETTTLQVRISNSQSASGSEAHTEHAALFTSDTGTDSESGSAFVESQSLSVSDSGSGSDSATLRVGYTLLDSGSGVDSFTYQPKYSVTDTATSTEFITDLTATITTLEFGTGIESGTTGSQQLHGDEKWIISTEHGHPWISPDDDSVTVTGGTLPAPSMSRKSGDPKVTSGKREAPILEGVK